MKLNNELLNKNKKKIFPDDKLETANIISN